MSARAGLAELRAVRVPWRRLAAVAAVAAVAAAGWSLRGGSAPWRTFHADGVTVRYPPGWYATARPLTHVTAPQQVLAVASFPLPAGNAGADGCEPTEVFRRMPPDGAFLYGWTYGDAAATRLGPGWPFPPRPRHFTLRRLGRYECMRLSYMLTFAAGGRAFQVHVAFGPRATAATRARALQVLDSFRAE